MSTLLSLLSLAAAGPVDVAVERAHALGLDVEVVGFVEGADADLVQLQQVHQGVPVRGGGLHVRVGHDGTVVRVRGAGKPVHLNTEPTLDAAAAARIAVGRMGGEAVATTLVVDGERLAFEVRVHAGFADTLVRVDAHSGAVLGATALSHEAKGVVVGDNGREGVVELPGIQGDLLSSNLADVLSASDGVNVERQAVAGADGHFRYAPALGEQDPAEEVNVYFHLARTVGWYETELGHAWGSQFTAVVNVPESVLANATHQTDVNGDHLLVFGSIDGHEMGDDPDVVLHEVGHGAANEVARFDDALPSYPFAVDQGGTSAAHGALIEALPDYFAATQHDDPVITLGNQVRSLVNDARCPDDQVGEAHFDSLVVSGTLWEVRDLLGAARADAVVWQLAAELPAEPTFRSLADTLRDLVADAGATPAELDGLEAILAERGLDACGRALELSAEPVSGISVGGLAGGACEGSGLGASLPYAFVVRGDGALDVTIDAPAPYDVHVRRGRPVTFATTVVDVSGEALTTVAMALADETVTDSPTSVRVEADGEPVFLAVVSYACPTAIETWSASAVPAP